MATWQLQEAKARFSELVETARTAGPQVITRRGVETAVLVPAEEWKRLQQGTGSGLTNRQRLEDGLRFLQAAPEFRVPPRKKVRLRKPVRL